MQLSRGIRGTAWALVGAGVAAPLLRRRLNLPKAPVLALAAAAPAAARVTMRPGRARDLTVCSLQMWAYLAAYEMPNDDAGALRERVHIEYPIQIDRVLGLGVIPTQRLQELFSREGEINRFERVLAWCHWAWFAVPHLAVVYVSLRRPRQLTAAAARMYAVFDLGAVVYWALPTAPPWWAAQNGYIERTAGEPAVRRMMLEYGERFWGNRWNDLYDALGANPLAAMPSLHFATSLMAARLLSEVDPVAGTAAWTYAGTLGLALIYLGEPYATDLIAGALLAEVVQRGARPMTRPARAVARLLDALGRLAGVG